MLPMHIHRTLSVALVIIWSAVGVSCSYGKGPCTKPTVRKEWRAFTTMEKAEWIRSVNVRMRDLPRIGCHSEAVILATVPVTPAS